MNNNGIQFITANDEAYISSTTFIISLTIVLATVISLVGSSIYHKKRRNDLVDELHAAQAKLRYLQDKLQREIPNNKSMTSNDSDDKKVIRIFMDGAFDLLHFGHMNAFRLARSLGTHLIVGVNSDESITKCKGPPLMNDNQRLTMVQACKFVDDVVPDCPYIMNEEYLSWVIQTYNIDYVVHGDDPCFVNGKDVYAAAKAAGKFRTIPRTAGVSTTDIVGRMLLLTKEHHYHTNDQEQDSVTSIDENDHQDPIITKELPSQTTTTTTTIRRRRSSQGQHQQQQQQYHHHEMVGQTQSRFLTTSRMLQLFSADVNAPTPNMRVIYMDGGWDLFHPGHVSILKKAKERGDYLLVGIHGDALVNRTHGMNLPLMNLHERVLSVLGCRYVDDVLIDAPLEITPEMITSLNISEVIHGTAPLRPDNNNGSSSSYYNQTLSSYEDIRYRHVKNLNIYTTIPYPTSFRITSVLKRIHTNQEAFQAKFETKMESERRYMATNTALRSK